MFWLVKLIDVDWLLTELATKALLAGSAFVLKKRAASPLVTSVNVYVAVFGAWKKPTSQTVSADELLET